MSLRDEARRCAYNFLSAFEDQELLSLRLYDTIIDEVERGLIEAVLTRCAYNQVWAADVLGVARNTLRHKIKKLGLCHLTPAALNLPPQKRQRREQQD